MSEDDPRFRDYADAEAAAEAFTTGAITIGPVPTPQGQAELLASLPPPDAPVSVVRPIRLPVEIDSTVKALAGARGVSMSALIRQWIEAGIAEASQTPDPVTELRRGLTTAQRALDELTRSARDAA